jgi:hypothetical protein
MVFLVPVLFHQQLEFSSAVTLSNEVNLPLIAGESTTPPLIVFPPAAFPSGPRVTIQLVDQVCVEALSDKMFLTASPGQTICALALVLDL